MPQSVCVMRAVTHRPTASATTVCLLLWCVCKARSRSWTRRCITAESTPTRCHKRVRRKSGPRPGWRFAGSCRLPTAGCIGHVMTRRSSEGFYAVWRLLCCGKKSKSTLKGSAVLSYQEFMQAAVRERGPDHPVFKFNDKMSGRRLGEMSGVRVPDLLQGPTSLRRLVAPEGPAILKPVNGCTARGGVPLAPPGDGAARGGCTGGSLAWSGGGGGVLGAKRS